MSIVVRFAPPFATAEQYDEGVRRLQAQGDYPPDGLDYHVCFLVRGNVRVSEIWDSREQFEAFGEKLMPVLSEAGVEFSGEPEVYEVHNLETR